MDNYHLRKFSYINKQQKIEEQPNKVNKLNNMNKYNIKSPELVISPVNNLNTITEKSMMSLQKNLSKLKNSKISTLSKNNSLISAKYQNILEYSGNFSINTENAANNNYIDSYQQDINCDNILKEVDFSKIDVKSMKNLILVYKYNDQILVPMILINEDMNTGSITLKYIDGYDYKSDINCNIKNKNNGEISIMKDLIFYQILSENSLSGVEELTYLNEINELSILKNLSVRISGNIQFTICKNIFMIILNKNDEFNSKYEFMEWLNNNSNDSIIFIKNKVLDFGDEIDLDSNHKSGEKWNNTSVNFIKNSQMDLVNDILKFKNLKLYNNYKDFFKRVYNIMGYFNMNSLLSFSFNQVHENYSNFQLYVIYPTQTFKNKLKSEYIFKMPNTKNSNSNKTVDNEKYKFILALIDMEGLFPLKYHNFLYSITDEILKQSEFFSFFEEFMEILKEINQVNLFKNVFSIFLLSYIIINLKNIFVNFKKLTDSDLLIYEEFKKIFKFKDNSAYSIENLIFYANTLIIFIFKFFTDLISLKFKENLPKNFSVYSSNSKLFLLNHNQVNLFTLLNNTNDEDINLFNDFIYNKISLKNESKNNLLFTKYLQYNFNENISNYLKILNYSQSELQIILYFEKIFNIPFMIFKNFYKLNTQSTQINGNCIKILEFLQISYKESFIQLEQLEKHFSSIRQIWSFEFANFEKFINLEENVIDFLHFNKLVEYANFYKNKFDFYIEFSHKDFFNKFLPILEDIDDHYDSNKKYSNSLKIFFDDLQKFEDFEENFDTEKNMVRINYYSYWILKTLTKHLVSEKTIIIQKHYKRSVIQNFIKFFRKKVSTIQNIWRKYFYRKISNFNFNNSIDFIFNRYKRKDPLILKIFRQTNFINKNLILENSKIKEKQTRLENENANHLLTINELNKKFYKIQSDFSSVSSTYADNKNYSNISNNNSSKYSHSLLKSYRDSSSQFYKSNMSNNSVTVSSNKNILIKSKSKNKFKSSFTEMDLTNTNNNFFNNKNISLRNTKYNTNYNLYNSQRNNSTSSAKYLTYNDSNKINIKKEKKVVNKVQNKEQKNMENKQINYKSKYLDLSKTVNEHEKKLEKLVTVINSKPEIKDVLAKYNISIN